MLLQRAQGVIPEPRRAIHLAVPNDRAAETDLSLRMSWAEVLFLVGTLALRLAPSPYAGLAYVAIAIYAIGGYRRALWALAMTWLFTLLNPGIVQDLSVSSVGRYVVLAGAGLGVLIANLRSIRDGRMSKTVMLTCVFGAYIVLHALVVSPFPDVSVLKATSWTVATATILSAWRGLGRARSEHLLNELYSGLVALVLCSVPLIWFMLPLGYLRNGMGFQGLLNHPQVFGVTAAVVGVRGVGFIMQEPKPSWKHLALMGASVALVVISKARVAGLSMILAPLLAVGSLVVMGRHRPTSIAPGLASPRVFAMLAMLMIVGVFMWPSAVQVGQGFLSKRGDSVGIAEAYKSSRGALLRNMLANIGSSPFRGIGFGIASDPSSMMIARDAYLNLPSAAAVEKGIAPVAVLEELGVFGFLLSGAWVLLLASRAFRNGVASLSILYCVLLVNFAESSLFSLGGMGLLLMILLGWASTSMPLVLGTDSS